MDEPCVGARSGRIEARIGELLGPGALSNPFVTTEGSRLPRHIGLDEPVPHPGRFGVRSRPCLGALLGARIQTM